MSGYCIRQPKYRVFLLWWKWTRLQLESTGKDLGDRESKLQEVLKIQELFSPGQRKSSGFMMALE